MKMSSDKITLWVIVRDGEEVSDLKRLQFNAEEDDQEFDDPRYVKAKFFEAINEQLDLPLDKTKIFKLRNGRGSLIPLGKRTPQNTVTSPYILEVCEKYSSVKPCPRKIDIPCYNETCKRKLEMFTKRISRLEDTIPQLPHLRDARLSAEMKDLEDRLKFLHAKLTEAESRQWKGMFTKYPLW